MGKKISLVITMFLIFYFSNTPNLYVLDPSSWFNQPQFEKNITVRDLFSFESPFFLPYQDIFHVEFLLHKLGHITFYSLLTFVFYLNLKKMKTFKTWCFVTFYAFTDEVHQFFIVGRSGRMYDVLLDSTACFLTLLLISIFFSKKTVSLYKKVLKKVIKNNSY